LKRKKSSVGTGYISPTFRITGRRRAVAWRRQPLAEMTIALAPRHYLSVCIAAGVGSLPPPASGWNEKPSLDIFMSLGSPSLFTGGSYE
jgi:hypothetical protein